jgi:hypothetical protein
MSNSNTEEISSTDQKEYSMVFKDKSLKLVCLRINWMPHGNHPIPSNKFPENIYEGECLRLIFDIFTTTLPKFGMNGLIQLCDSNSGNPISNFPLLGANVFQTAPFLNNNRLRGFKHRCLVLVRIPKSNNNINFDKNYRFGLVVNLLKKPRDEGYDSESLYIRFVSLPFLIKRVNE